MSTETNEGVNDVVEHDSSDNNNIADDNSGDNISLPDNQGQPDNNETNNNDVDNNADSDSDNVDDSPGNDEQEHPDWFMKDKFKNTEEQAKAYSELQKKMGKFWGAPKDDYTLDGVEGITKDDPLVANLVPALKELGLSQDGFNTLVKQYQEANVNMMKKYAEDLKKELTENDAHTYQECDKWMRENFSEEEMQQVQNNWLMTPQDFKLFNVLRLKAGPSSNVPNQHGDNTIKFESSKDVTNEKIKYRTEIREKLRAPDKNYENELASRFKDARQRELRSK
jgi:hypothetical protein